jgi:hypothetical protein
MQTRTAIIIAAAADDKPSLGKCYMYNLPNYRVFTF